MLKAIRKYEEVALSSTDILELLNGRANIVLYPNLYKYTSIDELLEPYGAFILLFESKPKYGHWTCVFKLDDDTLEFFNPYGGYPDDSLEYIPNAFSIKSNQDHTYLSHLLLDSPYSLTYNEYKFQKISKDTRTCGRHCVVRLWFKYLPLEDYYKLLKKLSAYSGLNFDQIVTVLTETNN